MRKYLSIFAIALFAVFSFAACDPEQDEEAGGTNVQDMCGFWTVTASIVNSDGTLTQVTDPFVFTTSTTAANDKDSIIVNDNGNLWNFKFKVHCDYAAKTFSCAAKNYNVDTPSKAGNATITDGKVLMGQGHNIHNMPCDSISFRISFDDDDESGRVFQISGTRYAGFTE